MGLKHPAGTDVRNGIEKYPLQNATDKSIFIEAILMVNGMIA
jgi:hypothetical protein